MSTAQCERDYGPSRISLVEIQRFRTPSFGQCAAAWRTPGRARPKEMLP